MTKQEIVAQIQNEILTLEFAPGSTLDETELAKRFGVSRTPIREILRQLEGEGYAVSGEIRGNRVIPLDLSVIQQFFTAATQTYAFVIWLAAENATADECEQLQCIQHSFKQAVTSRDVQAMVTRNNRFHLKIGEMAHNCFLLPTLKRLLIDHGRIAWLLWRDGKQVDWDGAYASSEHHDRMIAEIRAGNAEAAVNLSNEHWELSKHHMLSYFSKQTPSQFSPSFEAKSL